MSEISGVRGAVLPRQVLGTVVQVLFTLAYPLVIYLAFSRLETRAVAGLLLALYAVSLLLRARGSLTQLWQLVRPHLGLVLLIGLALAAGHRTALLLLPVLVSLYLLGTFARSLRQGPPMVERFARVVEDDLPDFTLPYCRKVTVLWCVFLAANAVGAAWLAFFAPLGWWALYTGAVFYLLLGILFAVEFVVRKLWFRHYTTGLADRLFARLFPAGRTANGRRSLAYVEQRRAHDTSSLPQ